MLAGEQLFTPCGTSLWIKGNVSSLRGGAREPSRVRLRRADKEEGKEWKKEEKMGVPCVVLNAHLKDHSVQQIVYYLSDMWGGEKFIWGLLSVSGKQDALERDWSQLRGFISQVLNI